MRIRTEAEHVVKYYDAYRKSAGEETKDESVAK